jgi:RNA-binding protein
VRIIGFVRGKRVLHRIGQVLHVSASKNMILITGNMPRIGDKVANEKLETVGTVLDVFGPTSNPYVTVKPTIQHPEKLVNQVLYSTSPKIRIKKRKKRR